MALILHLETATDRCSVCVSRDGIILAEREATEQQSHAAAITLLIRDCMGAAALDLSGLDAVAVSSGPGSYTSLRIGVSTAKGICYALGKPLIAVDTLEALAWTAREALQAPALYCPMVDARRMEVYTALFDAAGQRLEPTHALVVTASSFASYFEKSQQIVFTGNGAAKCLSLLPPGLAVHHPGVCSAAGLVPLAHAAFTNRDFQNISQYVPAYLKNPNITIAKKLI